ncbi:MAG: hypothetical protein REH83_05515, partial [Rickettsiella sp.]|nr:hypothetical protein [Rickettsiella sp.]
EHIKIYKNILQCCNNDKEQREITIENDNNDYEKNYLTYQENIFILDTAICSLTNIINGSCDISENLASIKKYYTTLNEITNIPSTLVKDKYQEATIQMALSRIRNLIARLKGQLTKIKTFTSQL